MITKSPSTDWCDQFVEYVTVEEDYDSMSDLDEFDNDFSDYLWMENEEEFDKNELKRLEEEELMNECLEAMFQDELEAELDELQKAWQIHKLQQLDEALATLEVTNRDVENSLLNPLADEFIPRNQLPNAEIS